ncbi:AEC family transporter [Halobellus inordinatus]|uniref:AEC family transporter n=1 Tax=Halobellus inordinatus TaxID=1126236 RepID=UPI00210C88B6|nr:AEC family transporter [Halobellus inordinatus]
MEVLGRLLGLLALLLVGTGLRLSGVLDTHRTQRLNDVAYYVALPALIFVSTYDRAIDELLTPGLLAGLLAVLFATAGVAWGIHRKRSAGGRQSVAIVQSYHSNIGYLGLPLVAATFDEQVTAIASVVLGVMSLTQVPLTVVVLTAINEADASLGDELNRLIRNPVLATLIAGLTIGSLGLSVPAPVTGGLDVLGTLALPIALLCVGASLQIDMPNVDLGATGSVVALKIALMPALGWLVFSLLSVDAATFTAAIVMLGTPTAVSTYVFATELGGDAEFASLNVFLTTLASVGSLFVLIRAVG